MSEIDGRQGGDEPTIAFLFPDWPQYAERLTAAVRDLTAEQLALRAGPEHAPIWALAAHLAGARTYWLCGVLGEPGAEATPFTDPSSGVGWEDDETHPRSGAELAWALESTWAVIASCLERWTPSMLPEPLALTFGDVVRYHSRGSILNRLLSHDAFHAGEISQLLGAHSLPAIDLWTRDRSRP
jgi:uncharacterized damage-inducible protein DinB